MRRETREERHVPRVHVSEPLNTTAGIRIEGDKAHHLRNVLRLRTGDAAVLFDGGGGEYDARVTAVDRGSVAFAVTAHRPVRRESPLRLELAQAIARGERMDFAVAKAVELGVHAIRPLFAARGHVKLDGARLEKKLGHWRRVATSAAEQSGREYVPVIHEPRTLENWLPDAGPGARLVLDPRAETTPGGLPPVRSVSLLVGPESGLTTAELDAARHTGFTPIRLARIRHEALRPWHRSQRDPAPPWSENRSGDYGLSEGQAGRAKTSQGRNSTRRP